MTTRFPLPECRGTTAGILETQASYERRAQGWQDRRDLAQQDVLIGQQQVSNALGQIQIVTQEQNIASIQADNGRHQSITWRTSPPISNITTSRAGSWNAFEDSATMRRREINGLGEHHNGKTASSPPLLT
jgi:hypothetical protein